VLVLVLVLMLMRYKSLLVIYSSLVNMYFFTNVLYCGKGE